MLGIEAIVIEMFRVIADDPRAIGLLRIDRVTMSPAVRDCVVDKLGRRFQLHTFSEMDRVVVFTAVNPPSPGLSNSIVSNDYSNLPVSIFRIRIEVDPVSADAFEYEPVDDNIPLLAFFGGL